MEYITENGSVLTDAMLDEMAKEYEDGTWSGHGPVSPGRPPLFDEEMVTVSFRMPISRVQAVETAARKYGQSKSEFFREAVESALLARA